jgi:hypothetical protein
MLFQLQMEMTMKVNRLGLTWRQFMACFKLLFAWIIEGNCHISVWPVYLPRFKLMYLPNTVTADWDICPWNELHSTLNTWSKCHGQFGSTSASRAGTDWMFWQEHLGFCQSLHGNAGNGTSNSINCCLPHPFQFIFHQLSYHLMPYNQGYR